jgi:hypothetical protein
MKTLKRAEARAPTANEDTTNLTTRLTRPPKNLNLTTNAGS